MLASAASLQPDSVSLCRTDSGMQLSILLRADSIQSILNAAIESKPDITHDTTQSAVKPLSKRKQREQMLHIEPLLVCGHDTAHFPDMLIFNKRAAQHHHNMSHRLHPLDTAAYQISTAYFKDTIYTYRATMPFEQWMDNAALLLFSHVADCHSIDTLRPAAGDTLLRFSEQTRQRIDTTWVEYVVDSVGTYTNISRVCFPWDKTILYPNYMNNVEELAKINNNLSRFLNNDSIRVTRITLHGYASPEGPYAHNTMLARGRTNTIKNYINARYHVPDTLIHVRYTSENWKGFRDSIIVSDIPYKKQLLNLISKHWGADVRLETMERNYPKVMKRLERDLFPKLRYTEYTIDYECVHGIVHTEMLTEEHIDTIIQKAQSDSLSTIPRRRPIFEVKTNLLFDAALAPNIEVEIPIGFHPWSIMLEWWTPWYVWGNGTMGNRAYSFMLGGVELRYWFRNKNDYCQPVMNGHFLGLYGAGGFYDIQTGEKGWQGEYSSLGLTYGYVLPLAAHWNMEFSVSAGYVGGPQRYYKGMFNDEHLIYQRDQHLWYVGPTKLKISIGYMFNIKEKKKRIYTE